MEAEEGSEQSEMDSKVSVEKVVSVDAIQCTIHQIKEARKHAAEHFPGAKYDKGKAVRRGGLAPAEAQEVAEFLRDKSVVEVVSK